MHVDCRKYIYFIKPYFRQRKLKQDKAKVEIFVLLKSFPIFQLQ